MSGDMRSFDLVYDLLLLHHPRLLCDTRFKRRQCSSTDQQPCALIPPFFRVKHDRQGRQTPMAQVDLLTGSLLCFAWIYVRGPRDDLEDVSLDN